MPMSFPTMESLKNRAKQRGFRQPGAIETEDHYRADFAKWMLNVDRLESAEIALTSGGAVMDERALLSHMMGEETLAELLEDLSFPALPQTGDARHTPASVRQLRKQDYREYCELVAISYRQELAKVVARHLMMVGQDDCPALFLKLSKISFDQLDLGPVVGQPPFFQTRGTISDDVLESVLRARNSSNPHYQPAQEEINSLRGLWAELHEAVVQGQINGLD